MSNSELHSAQRRPVWRRWLLGVLLRLGVVGLVLGLLSGRLLFALPEGPSAVRSFGEVDGDVDGTVSVLVWNVHKGADPAWSPAFASLASSSDLVLLQEVDDNPTVLLGLDRVPGLRWDLGTMWARRWNGLGSGPAIGARLTRRAPTELVRTFDREAGVWTPKAALVARLDLEGESLLVISVHGLNLASVAATEDQLWALAQTIDVHRGPLLLAGDFNTWHVRKRAVLDTMVHRLELQPVPIAGDARAKPFGVSFEPTDEWAVTFGVTPLVDLAFVRGLEVKGGEAYPVPEPGSGRVRASDHPALRFSIRRR